MGDQIGITGNAMKRGIMPTTVAWPAQATPTHSLTIFNSITKAVEADVAQSKDNSGETIEMNRTNKRIKLSIEAKPIGAAAADAQAIAADLPQKMDLVIITCATDTSLATTFNGANSAVVDSCSAKWSPDGELIVSMEITVWIAKAFIALS